MLYKLARALLLASVPILLVATPLYLLITPGYVHRAYARSTFPASTLFVPQERQRLSDTLVNYLRGRATREEMAELRTDAGNVAMRPSEVQHMVDVKQVTDGFFVAHAIAVIAALGSSVVLLMRQPLGWARSVRHGLWATGLLIVVVSVAAAADFDLFFTWFHRVFFQEGTWLFYYEDTLIQLYPLPFWIRAVAEMVFAMVMGGAVLYGASRWVEVRALRRSEP